MASRHAPDLRSPSTSPAPLHLASYGRTPITPPISPSSARHLGAGGKPGYFPSLKKASPHPVPLEYYDPFGLFASKYKTAEDKSRGLLVELNNGRLAMVGLMGALSASKGCIVPGMDSLPIA